MARSLLTRRVIMRTILFTILLLSPTLACTINNGEKSPPNPMTGSGGKADDGTTSTDTRHLICQLEYEVFSPTFATAPAASIDTTYDKLYGGVVTATDGTYTLSVSHNSANPNLPFNAIVSDKAGTSVTYGVLPDLATTEYFNFEIGGWISPTPIGGTTYDHLRAYCAARAN
jgi:hypothetical protein